MDKVQEASNKATDAGIVCNTREMTVEEIIKSRIERKQRDIAELMQLSDSLPFEMRQMSARDFEDVARLFYPHAWR